MKHLLQYELNEVPWVVLQKYVSLRPKSSFSRFINNSKFVQTHIKYNGELHPWSTWPTFHRGCPISVHNIRMINQVISETAPLELWLSRFEPSRVALSAPFHSANLPQPIQNNLAYYLPDGFQIDKKFPHLSKSVRLFRHLQGAAFLFFTQPPAISTLIRLLTSLFYTLISPRLLFLYFASFVRCFLIAPPFSLGLRHFATCVDTDISFRLLCDSYAKNSLDFSVFFTNHLAASMHRDWHKFIGTSNSNAKKSTVYSSLRLVDCHLHFLLNSKLKFGPTHLALVSSMGQSSVPLDDFQNAMQLQIVDFKKFEHYLRQSFQCSSLEIYPAMRPDFSLVVQT